MTNPVIENILTRRTIRRFQAQQIQEDELQAILEGGCYIGSAWDSFSDPFGQETLKKWNVRTDYYAALHVLLGYPRDEQTPKGNARKDGGIIRV